VQTVVRVLCACVVLVVLVLVCALPIIVSDDEYGDVSVPGAGTVHLPVGQTDVALCSRPLTGSEAVPPPSLAIRITSLDGGPDPETVELRREASGNGCDVLTQISAVRILREGDYRVTVDGDVYGPYQPRLVFGDFIWDPTAEPLLGFALVILVIAVSLVFGLGVPVIMVFVVFLAIAGVRRLFGMSDVETAESPDPPAAEPLPICDITDWPPEDFVLHYPQRRGGVAKFALFFILLVVVPTLAAIWHLTVPDAVNRPAVSVLVCWVVGCGYTFWRINARWLLIRERRARGEGWLRLSAKGFEVHERWGQPRHYGWNEIETFALVETTDGEGGVSKHVGIHFTPEQSRADRNIAGYWDCSLDHAVDLLNGWLLGYQLARGLDLV
jgi:hypothetical protein